MLKLMIVLFASLFTLNSFASECEYLDTKNFREEYRSCLTMEVKIKKAAQSSQIDELAPKATIKQIGEYDFTREEELQRYAENECGAIDKKNYLEEYDHCIHLMRNFKRMDLNETVDDSNRNRFNNGGELERSPFDDGRLRVDEGISAHGV